MANRILTENGNFLATLGDKGIRDSSRRPGHPQPNRPNPSVRHSMYPRRVDMTGHLVANDDDDSSSSSSSECSPAHKETLLSHPRSGRNHGIAQTEEVELDEIEIRFKNIVSGYNDHKRLLSKYRDRKEKLRTTKSLTDKKEQLPQVYNNTIDTTPAPEANSLRENRILQNHGFEETKGADRQKIIRPEEQHSNPSASKTLPKITTVSTNVGPDISDKLTADYFLRKIQALDKVINSWFALESPTKQIKVTGRKESQRNHRGIRMQVVTGITNFNSRIVNAAGEVVTKRPDSNGAGIPRGFSATKRPTKVQTENEETKAHPKSQEEHNGATTRQIMRYDPSSGLNETMSTWSISRDVEMGDPLQDEKNSDKKCTTAIKNMASSCRSWLLSPRRLLLTSGILLAIIILYGVGILLGYVSSMNSTTN